MKRFLTFASAGIALLVGGSGWIAFYPAVPSDLDGAPDLDAVAEEVRIPLADGDALDGYVLAGDGKGVIVMFHGYGRMHDRMWRYAQFLAPEGYTLVTVDFRSSRADDRVPTTLGHYEQIDAQATIDWVREQPWAAGQPIGLLGESLGASVALIVAAANPDVKAVLADCPFASGERVLHDSFERWAHLPPSPAPDVVGDFARAMTGFDPADVDVVSAAEKLRETPIFFVHVGRDDRIGPEQARDLWRAAGEKDPIWYLPRAGHNEAWQLEPELYEARASEFFGVHLRGEGPAGHLTDPDLQPPA